jgi:crotonobetainyl-CoA:carnitine CoA-transferase CaiB-like acyl-CoA transferase
MLEGILPEYSYHGAVRQRTGNIAHNSAPTNAYPTSDGSMVCIAANTAGLFQTLCRILERDDFAEDPSLATNEGRVARGEELDEAIASWTRTRTAGEVVEILRDHHVPVSRMNSIADIVADPQFRARGAIVEIEDDRLERPLLVPGVVPRLSRTPGVVPPLAQNLGEATEEMRARFGRHEGTDPDGQVGQHGTG